MSKHTGVTLSLDHEEALVLFDFLQREVDLGNGTQLKHAIKHDGELWALNGLNCLLEKQLVEPFQADCEDVVSQARAVLVQRSGPWPA